MTPAKRWLEGEISTGKLIDESGLRPCWTEANDLIGSIANAYEDKIREMNKKLDEVYFKTIDKYEQSEEDYANCEGKTAYAARIVAIGNVRIEFKDIFGNLLK